MTAINKVDVSIAKAFNLPVPAELTVPGYEKPSSFTPKRDDNYQFVKETLSDILAWMHISETMSDGLFLTGPTGAGKSSVICQVMARLNMPLQQLNAHAHMELSDLIGQHIVMDGDLIWQDGPLTTAYRLGHAFLLDEIDLLDPGVATGLNAILEGRPLVLSQNGGQIVHPHKDFRFIATGNTNGGGDSTGLWSGTTKQNTAFMDRMWVIEVGYLPAELEEKVVLASAPDLPGEIVKGMVEYANEVRDLFMGQNDSPDALEITLSTRTLVRWAVMSLFMKAKAAQGINPFKYSLERALANRGSPTTKQYLLEMCDRRFGKNAAL